MLEIERKFLIQHEIDVQELNIKEIQEIEQIYLKDTEDVEERIRKIDIGNKTVYTHTIKKNIYEPSKYGSVKRQELETDINRKTYNTLKRTGGEKIITKTRYVLEVTSDIIKEVIIDVFDNFSILEVELFEDIELSAENTKNCLGDYVFGIIVNASDVSTDDNFKNKNLAKPLN